MRSQRENELRNRSCSNMHVRNEGDRAQGQADRSNDAWEQAMAQSRADALQKAHEARQERLAEEVKRKEEQDEKRREDERRQRAEERRQAERERNQREYWLVFCFLIKYTDGHQKNVL